MNLLKNYKRFKKFYAPLLNKLSTICVQGESDKKNFEQLTINKIQVMGNLKFDQIPPKETVQNSKKMKHDLMIKDQIVIVAGSTREGEEEIILNEILKMNKRKYFFNFDAKTPGKI